MKSLQLLVSIESHLRRRFQSLRGFFFLLSFWLKMFQFTHDITEFIEAHYISMRAEGTSKETNGGAHFFVLSLLIKSIIQKRRNNHLLVLCVRRVVVVEGTFFPCSSLCSDFHVIHLDLDAFIRCPIQ